MGGWTRLYVVAFVISAAAISALGYYKYPSYSHSAKKIVSECLANRAVEKKRKKAKGIDYFERAGIYVPVRPCVLTSEHVLEQHLTDIHIWKSQIRSYAVLLAFCLLTIFVLGWSARWVWLGFNRAKA